MVYLDRGSINRVRRDHWQQLNYIQSIHSINQPIVCYTGSISHSPSPSAPYQEYHYHTADPTCSSAYSNAVSRVIVLSHPRRVLGTTDDWMVFHRHCHCQWHLYPLWTWVWFRCFWRRRIRARSCFRTLPRRCHDVTMYVDRKMNWGQLKNWELIEDWMISWEYTGFCIEQEGMGMLYLGMYHGLCHTTRCIMVMWMHDYHDRSSAWSIL